MFQASLQTLPFNCRFNDINGHNLHFFPPKPRIIKSISATTTSSNLTNHNPHEESSSKASSPPPPTTTTTKTHLHNQSFYGSQIQNCINSNSFELGKSIHLEMIESGFSPDTYLQTKILMLYARSGELNDLLFARKLFDEMLERNSTSWNTMIIAYSQMEDHSEEAWSVFHRMEKLGVVPDHFTFATVLRACSSLRSLDRGMHIHSKLIVQNFVTDVFVGNSLIDMYAKCGDLDSCLQVFEHMTEKNQVTWNSMISAKVQYGQFVEALALFSRMCMMGFKMDRSIQPDQYTFTSLLALCADQGDMYLGMQIHAHAIRMVTTNRLIIETELVHMYAKCGLLNYAQHIFDRMEMRNSYSWNSLIEGYEQIGQAKKSLELFKEMQAMGIKPDCFSLASAVSACIKLSDSRMGKETHGFIVRNSLEKLGILKCVLVDMYSKCGDMDYACNAYNQTSEKDRNIISWNSIILGFSKVSKMEETFKLFIRMLKEGIECDTSTLVTLFNFCAKLPALPQGIQLHTLAIKKGLVNTSIAMDSTLIDMYAKGGDIIQARRFFDKMTEKNIVSWNTMITGYAKHGCSDEVLVLYERMQEEGLHPNDVTLLSVLSACSHTGLIKEGLEIFIAMLEDHRLEATAAHYTCMVDLLGRAGRLKDAKEVIERMPVKPEVSTWGALLGACRVHQNVEMGRHAADHLFEMDLLNPGHYVLMSNIYAAAGSWKEVEEIRSMMKIRGVRKDAGVSWIEINNEIQTFYAGAKSHPKSKEIYANLRHLTQRMKRLGYVPDTKFVLSNTGDLEEEEYLFQHSERLAISLGLISLSEKSTIRVFKNLRVCGDCHTVTKLISKITNRRIIVRDTNRFHHFENGVCSCGDYW
ncbi:hypothetical protein AQUCO_00400420v1 [Aquilegia coerulea]|uniref:DYW domain-containing protein n=1 Tax=Aquilegia coerulea TaxID=218851 RepID=A0A2G5EUV7_AQUCA|nr:hypothetical protein AQUCO_00400420v1 [Aquilegia coerulea]